MTLKVEQEAAQPASVDGCLTLENTGLDAEAPDGSWALLHVEREGCEIFEGHISESDGVDYLADLYIRGYTEGRADGIGDALVMGIAAYAALRALGNLLKHRKKDPYQSDPGSGTSPS